MTSTLFDIPDVPDDVAPEPAPATPPGPFPADDAGQWRLAEVQIANWGTFDGAIYRMPVARRGHLLTGPSGSGKSSLLDAIATVLTPTRFLKFNEAAQGGRGRANQRTIVSYVRGAWSRQNDELEDRIVAAYLRPTATWSGVLLRYEDGTGGVVTAARLFFLRGTSTANADLDDMCVLERSALDLAELQEYARGGIAMRKAKERWPRAVMTTNGNHGSYYTRLCAALGIATESTLRLLHKTQSAKSLDSLDDLFRQYMLDEPRTFAIAANAVDQFSELDDAHRHVVQLREQRDHLRALAATVERFDAADAAGVRAAQLAGAVPAFQKHREDLLLRGELIRCTEDVAVLESAARRASADLASAEDAVDVAHRLLSASGGERVEALRSRVADARTRLAEVTRRRDWFTGSLADAGIASPPTNEREHAELLTEIRTIEGREHSRGPSHEELERLHAAKDGVGRVDREITALRVSGTTVPSALLGVRDTLAAALDLPTSALPFAAELIEVHPAHAAWTGAIERVLRPFALSLLVRSEHLPDVRRWVDNHRIETRLVYEEVPREVPAPRPLSSDLSLVRRVTVAEGTAGSWVAAQLAARYDVACVEDADALDDHERAVTLNGQIRTSRTRYEKDDRVRIEDRTRWVLGDRAAKHEALLAERAAHAAELDAATRVVTLAERRHAKALTRVGTLRTLSGVGWSEVDVSAAATELRRHEAQLEQLTSASGDLAAASAAVDVAEKARDLARRAATDATAQLANARSTLTQLESDAVRVTAELASGAFPPVADEVATELERRFRQERRKIDRGALFEVGQKVERALGEERVRATAQAEVAARDGQTVVVTFAERWPAAAGDLTASFDDRIGYLDLLARIVAHGLPDHEDQFFRLLRERSRDLVGHLVAEIHGAMREVEEKLEDVNTSLRRSPFDADRFLRLRPKALRSPTVQQFIADLRSISSGAWSDADVANAEQKFATLAQIMATLASSDRHDQKLRAQWLDTREHMTFLAEEVDEHGRVHATYDSGAAMSGGQQQKLVVFCLAAALRFQLARPEETRPTFGTVIFDEAFDKADSRYTRMALDVFVEFGFQLVLATPQKLLQTIEPYVGAVTSVENPTRRHSLLSSLDWESARRAEAAPEAAPHAHLDANGDRA